MKNTKKKGLKKAGKTKKMKQLPDQISQNGVASIHHKSPVTSSLKNGFIDGAPFSNQIKTKPVKRAKKLTKEEALKGTDTPVRVYADGIFDLFHFGHARVLMQAKAAFPNVHLVVGVCNDEITHKMKGFTVMTEQDRYESVRHCRYVDEVITDAPWILTPEFLDEHCIDFVAHDDISYNCGDVEDVYQFVKDSGMFVSTQRTEGISTTDLIIRIIKDYDLYVRRNLERGHTYNEMNVGYFKNKELQIKKKLDDLKKTSANLLEKWEEKSKELMLGFVRLFESRDSIKHIFVKGKSKLQHTQQLIKGAISPSGEYIKNLFLSSDEEFHDFE